MGSPRGPGNGLQLAGGAAVAGQVNGLQIAVINVGDAVNGVQLGVINVAREVRGAQVGVINLAENADASVGLLSLVRNGRFDLELYGSDLAPANVSIKMGGRSLYTYLAAGSGLPSDEGTWTAGGGFGTHLPLGRWSLDLDLGAQNQRSYVTGVLGDSLTSQLRAQVAFHVAQRFALFAGPTLNVRVRFDLEESGSATPMPVTRLSDRVQLWPGLVAGVRI